MVKMRKEGERKKRSIRISEIPTPLLTINSIRWKILSMRRMTVNTIKPMKNTGRISLRI
jgi:ribosomal protein S6E (S10)